MRTRLFLTILTMIVSGATPALAIINGQPADPDQYPYYAVVGTCGGGLIAPDRVITAGHCIDDLVEGQPIWLGGPVRRTILRVAANPSWEKNVHRQGRSVGPHDVGIVQLDAPVTTITPLRLAGAADTALWAPGAKLRVVGQGSDSAEDTGFGPIRTAEMEAKSDADCRKLLRSFDSSAPYDYSAKTMLCVVDPDHQAPYTSPCYGDSGSPLTAVDGTGANVLVGVDNWGIACGALGGDPEMFTQPDAVTAFATNPTPVWRPLATDRPVISGSNRVGGTAYCAPPHYADPQPGSVRLNFVETNTGYDTTIIGHGTKLHISPDMRGEGLTCSVTARSAGGSSTVWAYKIVRIK